jgi:hypothetical protein
MTKEELVKAIFPYLDVNKLVKPNLEDINSANGVLYTSVLQILTKTPYYQSSIDACFKSPGLLMRTPEGDYGQEQMDDYLGIACTSIVTGRTSNARAILWYGLTHLFVFNNDGKLQLQDFLGRYPFVFMYMFAAAFPFLKWAVYIPLTLNVRNFNPMGSTDSSGLQLQFIQILAYEKLYNKIETRSWFSKYGKLPSTIFEEFYEKGHPFIQYIKDNYDQR